MAKKYPYRRFIQNPIPKKYDPQPRDDLILQRLQEYKDLDTYQFLALLRPFGLRNLRRRLQYLFHDGLVERRRHDPGPIVYSITRKGRESLARKSGGEAAAPEERNQNPRTRKNRGREHTDHTLMVSNFRAALSLAVEPLEKTHLVFWKNEGPDLKARVKVEGQPVAVIPDSFIIIKHQGKPRCFFLEADRSTMTNARYLAKLKAYWLWWKIGGHQRLANSLREKLKQQDQGQLREIETSLGHRLAIPSFRVLTLTISEKRKENLRQLAKQADDKKQGSPMFLFAFERCAGPRCEGCREHKPCPRGFNLQQPETILNPIWQTPVNDDDPLLPDAL